MPDRQSAFHRLVELMETLRGPEGCPWDREQTRETLRPMLVEETYEVLHALEEDADPEALCEELGDLLFHIIFHSQIAKEREEFDAYDVCRRVYEKMVRRHPHVFGDSSFENSDELLKHWEDIKASEKAAVGKKNDRNSLLDGIPEKLPAMYTAYQITAKAARIGFDWPDLEGVRDKILEEFDELEEALESADAGRIKEEVGDILFAALNVARRLEIDPETALAGSSLKFTERFRAMERHFSEQGKPLKDLDLDEMEACWQNLKRPASGQEGK